MKTQSNRDTTDAARVKTWVARVNACADADEADDIVKIAGCAVYATAAHSTPLVAPARAAYEVARAAALAKRGSSRAT